MPDDYDERINLLIKHTASIHKHERNNAEFKENLTKDRQTLSLLIKHLEASSKIMATENIELSLEDDYSREVGGDSSAYKKLVYDIQCFIEVASTHKKTKYPKRALKYAALGYVLTRWLSGKDIPSLYEHGPDVQEFKSLCERVGLSLSIEAYRSALSLGLKNFDRHLHMPEYEYLF